MPKPIPIKRKGRPAPPRKPAKSKHKFFVLIQPNAHSRVGQGITAEVLTTNEAKAKELFAARLGRTPPSRNIEDWSECIGKWDHIRGMQPGVVRTLEDVLKRHTRKGS